MDTVLTFEEFATILSLMESVLNSRPLVRMSDNPSDSEVLSPGHFIIGRPLVALPKTCWQDTNMSRLP